MYTYMFVRIYIYTYNICVYVYVYVYIYIYICVCVYVCICICVCVYIYIYIFPRNQVWNGLSSLIWTNGHAGNRIRPHICASKARCGKNFEIGMHSHKPQWLYRQVSLHAIDWFWCVYICIYIYIYIYIHTYIHIYIIGVERVEKGQIVLRYLCLYVYCTYASTSVYAWYLCL